MLPLVLRFGLRLARDGLDKLEVTCDVPQCWSQSMTAVSGGSHAQANVTGALTMTCIPDVGDVLAPLLNHPGYTHITHILPDKPVESDIGPPKGSPDPGAEASILVVTVS